MQPPGGSAYSRHWGLDPSVTFLNHGSFGACPTEVLAAQIRYRDRMERQPLQFMIRDVEELYDDARAELAAFVGADPLDVVFVPNATTGVNTVLRSLHFERGDELLTTTHEYNACRNALDFVAERSGATVVAADIPFPVESPEEITRAVLERVGPRTRLGLFDHITSLTGMVMPIADIVRGLSERGVDVMVDGAHAPGMLELDIPSIGAAYYTGNCHKWLCAPKGAALLYVRRDRQVRLRPLVISHGANTTRTDRSMFWQEFDWTGTRDLSQYLAVADSIRFMGSLLPGGWSELMKRNRSLALEGRDLIGDRLGVEPACPDSMIGSLASIPLGTGRYRFSTTMLDFDPLEDALREEYGIEVPVLTCPDGPASLLRISAQIYNRIEQYEYLADAVLDIGRR
ncbi:aminotransferase class V-fold PLP-dependent enzyme [bacterium]|nr:aminotransferase class V-fold PLP-dependent enzyme [bacterium]